MLVVEPGRHHRIDPERVATTLELTPAEARVTVWLAERQEGPRRRRGDRVTPGGIHWHLKQIDRKQSLSQQADLVRLVLSLAELG